MLGNAIAGKRMIRFEKVVIRAGTGSGINYMG